MPRLDQVRTHLLRAGLACTRLIADPKRWINRRVETVQMLSHEETRRRVSIDFTLSDDELEQLTIEDGVVVPISVLTKEPRRNFDLRDEGGRAVPVLGREQNGLLAQIALLGAAVEAMPDPPPREEFEALAAELGEIVSAPTGEAMEGLGHVLERATRGDRWRRAMVDDSTCRSLLNALWVNYVLFAVLPEGGANRRILKYSYADGFTFTIEDIPLRDRVHPTLVGERLWKPDRRKFFIGFPGAWRAASFHAEVVIPDELRIELVALWDPDREDVIGEVDENVDRAALYASTISEGQRPEAYAVVAPERSGAVSQAALTSTIVAGLLWLGVASGLEASAPGPAVSIVTAGMAFFSGFAALQGQHRLVKRIYAASRLLLALVSMTALMAAALLALELPDAQPVEEWRLCALIASVAALRLVWGAIRAPGYRRRTG